MKKVLVLFISLMLFALPMMFLASCTDGDTTDGENSHPDEENPQESSLTEDEVMERLTKFDASPMLEEALISAKDSDMLEIVIEPRNSGFPEISDLGADAEQYTEYQLELYGLYYVEDLLNELAYSSDGEYLAYGEKIYTEGAADGKKWTKELYEEKLRYYGEDFLSEYIVNGVFLKDKAISDYEEALEKKSMISKAMSNITYSVVLAWTSSALELFTSEGYDVVGRIRSLRLTVSRIDFLNMNAEIASDYYFYLDGGIDPDADRPIDD
ncbi:MAG: hypothetical protein IJX38_04660 [Clostridia bacterium]|nr:hypothetical protein [Clostridia bacterium]